MKNITKDIKKAISKDILWSIDIFFKVLDDTEESIYKISFWQGEENWATIIKGNTVVAYLWKRYPLIFTDSANENNLRNVLNKYDELTFIVVNNLTDKGLQMDYEELKNYFDYGLTYNKFSVEDLWFNSNSI